MRKEDCYWFKTYGRVKNGCRILTDLQCEKTGKCSFYETTVEFKTRIAKFNEKHGTVETEY